MACEHNFRSFLECLPLSYYVANPELQIRGTELVECCPSFLCKVVGCDLTCIQIGDCLKVIGVQYVEEGFSYL